MRILAILLALPLAACGGQGGNDGSPAAPATGNAAGAGSPAARANGTGASRTYALSGFTGVQLRGSDDVEVTTGPFAVRAEGLAKELDQLKIEVDGDTLRIGRKDGVGGFNWGGGDHEAVTVHVALPSLTHAAIAGSGNLSVDRAGGSFKAENAGSGDLSVAALAADDASFSIAGSGNIAAKGQVKQLKIEIAGSGDVEGEGLAATGAEVSIAGSGSVKAAVNGPAKVSLMGSGDVDLGPTATCATSKMGSGDVRCGH